MAEKIGGKSRGAKLRIVTKDDNKTPEQVAQDKKDREEAEAIQLLSVVAAIKRKLPEVEAAAAAAKAKRDELTDIFRNAKAAGGFQRKELEELVADSKAGERKSVEDAEARRVRFRKAMGLPVGVSETEQELTERMPQVEQDAAFWRSAGYTAGVSGGERDAPVACVRAGHDNVFDEGWQDGQRSIAERMKSKAKETP